MPKTLRFHFLNNVTAVCKEQQVKQVYRATVDVKFGSPEATEQIPSGVICKVVYSRRSRDALVVEAHIYEILRDLQGRSIPRCLGLYKGKMEDGLAACLLLEDCRRELERKLYTDWRFRQQLFNTLEEMHCKGIKHGNIVENNIVVNHKGSPIIVDFSTATTKHDCQYKLPLKFDIVEPDEVEFGCVELHRAAVFADVWLPQTMRYMGSNIPTQRALTPEMLAESAPRCQCVPPQRALEEARLSLKVFHRALAKRAQCEPYTYEFDMMGFQ
ncbi:hypothetical protein BKA93DRAFT_809117 [Sparassis latifolia]